MFRQQLQAILQLSTVPGLGPGRLNALFDAMAATGLPIEALPDSYPVERLSRLGLSAAQAEQFVAAAPQAQAIADRVRIDELHLITRADPAWPTNLLRDDARIATPWLFVIGDPALPGMRSIGIGGSRDATTRSEAITANLVQGLVERGVGIVSGGARGIDCVAHQAALDAGGRTIVVLAQGIGSYQVPMQWRKAIGAGRLAIVSEYLPFDEWESFRAIQRNATIVQMSETFIVAQAAATGGTVRAGQAALKMRWPLYVMRQVGLGAEIFPGNEALIRQGGRSLEIPTTTGDLSAAVAQILAPAAPPVETPPAQLGLF